MGTVIAVCTSKNKGERKKNVVQGQLLKNFGLSGDAHAGSGNRQVSLLALESIQKMVGKGLKVGPGDFAENFTVEGIELLTLPIGARLSIGKKAIIRVTQIGKKCHNHCAIYEQAGDCIFPREGIFGEVLLEGPVQVGDRIQTLPSYRIGVITASDKGSKGERVDESGPLIAEMLLPWGDQVDYKVIPDERSLLAQSMKTMIDEQKVNLLITTGGTGLSPRDVTPEATMDIIERLVPGIPEIMRIKGNQKTPKAMLSRAVAGIRGRTLIINLPGSPRGVRENLEEVLPVLGHALEIISGNGGECGNQ